VLQAGLRQLWLDSGLPGQAGFWIPLGSSSDAPVTSPGPSFSTSGFAISVVIGRTKLNGTVIGTQMRSVVRLLAPSIVRFVTDLRLNDKLSFRLHPQLSGATLAGSDFSALKKVSCWAATVRVGSDAPL